MNTILEITNISKKIKNKTILEGVELTLAAGDVLALIGPNGAGKTTILRIITNLASASEGAVTINGFDTRKNHRAAMGRVGSLIEAPEFYNHLTGKQNLMLFGNMVTNRIPEEQLMNYAKKLDIYKALEQKVGSYSLGMRQRLGICVTLLGAPNVLLLDEPLNGLDPHGVIQVKKLLDQLSSEGMAVIISSHQLSELELMCNRYVMVDAGKITTTGDLNKTTNIDLQEKTHFSILTTDNARASTFLTETVEGSHRNKNMLNAQMNVNQLNKFIQDCHKADIYLIEIKKDEDHLERLFHEFTEEPNHDKAYQ